MRKTQAEYSRKWRAKNPERAREHARKWLAKNPEKSKEYGLTYLQKNKERRYAQTAQWKKDNPDKVAISERRHALKRKYGLTVEQYEALSAAQNHSCAICKTHRDTQRKGNLVVDHCHDSSAVRGLLCNDCNRALGLFRDSSDNVARAAKYLTA